MQIACHYSSLLGRMTMLHRFVIGSALLVALPAHADWTAKAEAGLVVASGNTETETANAKAELVNTTGRWKHAVGAAGLYASDEGERSAQRWELFGQSDYNFSAKTFWFGAARYEQDEFSGFAYQAILSTGLGRKFIETDVTKLIGTAGVGYKFFETEDVFDDTGLLIAPGDSDSDVVFRGTLDYEHKFTATTTLIDNFLVEAGADNTFVQNKLSVQVKMSDVLALAVGYAVRHNTDPPLGFEKTDTLMTVNLVYELK
jgi:putative salt-induced outer membrane protein